MDEGSPDIETGPIDPTKIDLAAIDVLDDSALAHSLRRIIYLIEHSGEDVAGYFQQSI